MKSTLKTCAAILREKTGEKDLVWADILGKSVHTIRHLEAGSLKLSAALAAKMNYESGISIQWLMDGNTAAPPISADGRAYTREIYDQVQARKKYFATVGDSDVQSAALDVLRAICAILVNANRKRNYHLAVYRIAKAIAELRDEFGEASDFSGYDKVLDYVKLLDYVLARYRGRESLPPELEKLIRENVPANVALQSLIDKQRTFKSKSKRPSTKRRRR